MLLCPRLRIASESQAFYSGRKLLWDADVQLWGRALVGDRTQFLLRTDSNKEAMRCTPSYETN